MEFLSAFDFSKPLSLYIHIPFCLSKCSYCAFYSKTGVSEEVRRSYVDKIVRQIDEITSRMDGPFYTAFIGGGNPGCLTERQLERICQAVCKKGRPLEFTTEINPESLTDGMTALFENHLTRLSMGVQSLSEEALSFLGRNARLEHTIRGMEKAVALREHTGCSISFDLITCLGKFHDAKGDVQGVVNDFAPDHLSLYALSLEEGTALFKKNPPIPDSEEQYDILMPLWLYLEDNGYSHYEVSNFAKPGFESLHNSVYWDYRPYIGVGCSAASTAFKDGCVSRFVFDDDVDSFIKTDLWGGIDREDLSWDEQLEEFVLMGLRHRKGLDLDRLKNDFTRTLPLIPYGFEVNNGFLVPDDRGLMVADSAAGDILDRLF